MSKVLLVLLTVGLNLSAAAQYLPENQQLFSVESAEIRLSLTGADRCNGECPDLVFVFDVLDKTTETNTRILLGNETHQVNELHIVNRSRGLVLGEVSSGTTILSLLDFDQGRVSDRFLANDPAVSPSGHLVVYEKFFPRHSVNGTSSQYLVYDLTASPRFNRTTADIDSSDSMNVGVPIYPPGNENRPGDNVNLSSEDTHGVASSEFTWIDDEIVAFADWVNGELSAIVADLRSGVRAPQIFSEVIDAPELSTVPACSELIGHPSPLSVRNIYRSGEEGSQANTIMIELQAGLSAATRCGPVELTLWGLSLP